MVFRCGHQERLRVLSLARHRISEEGIWEKPGGDPRPHTEAALRRCADGASGPLRGQQLFLDLHLRHLPLVLVPHLVRDNNERGQ